MLTDEQVRVIAAEALMSVVMVRRTERALQSAADVYTPADLIAAMARLVAQHPSTASGVLWSRSVAVPDQP
jgi:hypothetical protein